MSEQILNVKIIFLKVSSYAPIMIKTTTVIQRESFMFNSYQLTAGKLKNNYKENENSDNGVVAHLLSFM